MMSGFLADRSTAHRHASRIDIARRRRIALITCFSAGLRAAAAVAKPTRGKQMGGPVLRISISRCEPEHFGTLKRMMIADEAILRPGLAALPGFMSLYAGADAENCSLMNTSL
jgi:hypothetical protein